VATTGCLQQPVATRSGDENALVRTGCHQLVSNMNVLPTTISWPQAASLWADFLQNEPTGWQPVATRSSENLRTFYEGIWQPVATPLIL